MQLDGDLIDKIVSGVLERLRTQPGAARADGPAEPARPPKPPASSVSGASAPHIPHTLELAETVITADLLEQRLNGHGNVVIATRAVLTPSAREFLQRKKVEWIRGATTTPGAASGGGLAWKVIVLTSTPGVLSAVGDVLRGGTPKWERDLAGSDGDAAERVTSAICRGENPGVAVFSDRSDALACRANRNPQVRAAVVGDVRRVESARQELGANVIAIPPAGKSYFELRNILRAFAAGGQPRAPEGWNG